MIQQLFQTILLASCGLMCFLIDVAVSFFAFEDTGDARDEDPLIFKDLHSSGSKAEQFRD